jgi:hypothetical protein
VKIWGKSANYEINWKTLATFLGNFLTSVILTLIVGFSISNLLLKIGTLGVHVSAQRNSMVALGKHLNFEVTIQPAASYLVNCRLYSD